MVDKKLRQMKETALTPIAGRLGSYVSPTEITIIGGVFGFLAALTAWNEWYLIGLLLWIINRVLDGLDGTVARIFNKNSDFGGYIDIIVDNIVYAIIPIGLALSTENPIVYIALAILLGSFYVNSASWMILSSLLEKRSQGALSSGELTSVTMPSGLIEGTETIIFYALFFLLPQFMGALFLIMAVLIVITIAQRAHWAAIQLGK